MLNSLLKNILKRMVRIKIKYFNNSIVLTNNISYKSLLRLNNVKIMNGATILGKTNIGEYSYIGRCSEVCESNVGRYCSIANWVSIGIGEHSTHLVSTNSIFLKEPSATLNMGDVHIEDDVWIGTKATVLRGVKIGRGAVIGAGAVVTKDIPPYAIAVGVPAKVIKYRFDSQSISAIEESKWFEKNYLEAKHIISELDFEEHYK
ncbi:hypothetical protein ACS79_21535 [Vibrio lentus]|nr:hypothetical protein ACS79_21535 [Vibrio lentus]